MRSCRTLWSPSPTCSPLGQDLHARAAGGLENLSNALGFFGHCCLKLRESVGSASQQENQLLFFTASPYLSRIAGFLVGPEFLRGKKNWNIKRNSFYFTGIFSFLKIYFYLDPKTANVVKIDLKCN